MLEISNEVKAEIEIALEHLEKIIYSSDNYNPKYDPRESVYDFMYKFQSEKESVDGKLSVITKVLTELITEYKPDAADSKRWRE
ncbi:hypothetical protein NSQ20_12090 [Paenibacillus sp. FSL K6-1122]|uniref:hypothetical protein n=1 Tax=Paenibacillus sp. FSL K6-1122 TaxID=2954512 RepID=UPI0030EDA099